MKRLIAVLLVLVGTATMSFARGVCANHGKYTEARCPKCKTCNAIDETLKIPGLSEDTKSELKNNFFDLNCPN